MRFTSESCVVVSDEQVSTSLGNETVILGMGNGVDYGLDAVGARVWSLLDGLAETRLVREIAGEGDAALS